MLDEQSTCRAAAVKRAALMTGAGPHLVALVVIVHQRAEEWRLQARCIALEREDHFLRRESGGFVVEVEIAGNLAKRREGQLFDALQFANEIDRRVEPALLPDVLDQA